MTKHDEDGESEVLGLLGRVLEQERRVVRAEGVLATEKRRLAVLAARFGRLGDRRFDLVATCADERREVRAAAPAEDGTTMRERILAYLAGSPGEVFTPAMLAPEVGAASRDSVRNTLLVLAARGKVDKVGPGRYRKREDA